MELVSDKIKHPSNSYFLSFSRLFERIHYYGIRSILVLYLIRGGLAMSDTEAITFYTWTIGAYAFSKLIGGVIGDFVLSNRIALLIGAIFTLTGSFVLMIPEISSMYMGIGLLVFGNGLYSPNLLSLFGKGYYNKTKLLDAGFSIIYLMVNLGGFLGTLIIVRISITYGYPQAFMASGFLMLLSVFFLLFVKKEDKYELESKLSIDNRIFYSLGSVIVVSIFWLASSIVSAGYFELFNNVKAFVGPEILQIKGEDLYNFIAISCLFFSFFAIIIWSYFYYNPFIKLTIGSVLAALATVLLLFIPESMTGLGFELFILSTILYGIAEIHIGPVILSILTKYTHPKYLAIVMGIYIAIPAILTSLVLNLTNLFDNFPYFEAGTVIFGIIALLLSGIILVNNSKKVFN